MNKQFTVVSTLTLTIPTLFLLVKPLVHNYKIEINRLDDKLFLQLVEAETNERMKILKNHLIGQYKNLY